MFKGISTYILVVLVMWQNLAFAAMPCHMQPHKMTHTVSATHEAKMDHSAMHLDEMSMAMTSTGDGEDCCDTQCYCPTNACSALHFVTISNDYYPLEVTDERVESTRVDFTSNLPKSLYKPPIFA